MWRKFKPVALKVWNWLSRHAQEMKSWVCDLAIRPPTKQEKQFLVRFPAGMISAVITGMFFMAASLSPGVAMVIGVALILVSLVIYKWASGPDTELA
jgi:hypothetical protein